MPPHWGQNFPRLAAFLKALPAPYRWAMELREPSWLCEEIFQLLERHGVALCIHDLLPAHPHRIEACRIQSYLAKGLDVLLILTTTSEAMRCKTPLNSSVICKINLYKIISHEQI